MQRKKKLAPCAALFSAVGPLSAVPRLPDGSLSRRPPSRRRAAAQRAAAASGLAGTRLHGGRGHACDRRATTIAA
eukprot:COSAG05_NODE_193_length_14574_cov_23.070812_10_plen_75_part_00